MKMLVGGVPEEPAQAVCLGVAFERQPFGGALLAHRVLTHDQDWFEHRTCNIEH